jgi:hypothetical protein
MMRYFLRYTTVQYLCTCLQGPFLLPFSTARSRSWQQRALQSLQTAFQHQRHLWRDNYIIVWCEKVGVDNRGRSSRFKQSSNTSSIYKEMNYIMMEKKSRRFTTNGPPSFPNSLRTLAPSENKLLYNNMRREAHARLLFWFPRNLSSHMDGQARTGNIWTVIVNSIERWQVRAKHCRGGSIYIGPVNLQSTASSNSFVTQSYK